MQYHVIVLDTIGTTYTFYETEKRKNSKKKLNQRKRENRKKKEEEKIEDTKLSCPPRRGCGRHVTVRLTVSGVMMT